MNPGRTPSPDDRDRRYMLLALRAIGDFGATIAVPVVALALLGRWLDGRWGTGPWLTLAGLALAAVVSGISVVRKAKAYGRQYQDIEKRNDQPKP